MIRKSVFKKGYLQMIEKDMLNKERLGTVESDGNDTMRLTPGSFKEDPDDGCVVN